MNLREMAAEFERLNAEHSALLARGDTLTPEEVDRATELDARLSELDEQMAAASQLDAQRQRAEQRALRVNTPARVSLGAADGVLGTQAPATTTLAPLSPTQAQELGRPSNPGTFSVPAHALRARVSNLSSPEAAYGFGQWMLATIGGNRRSQAYCREHDILLAAVDNQGRVIQLAHNEVVNTQGGFLVPPQFESQLIDLREQYGVARTALRNRAMTSDALSIPRRAGGLTAYWVSDNEAITESTKNWNLVNLFAKKLGVLSKVSSELNEDAIINVADDLAGEISYAFALKEDQCAFIGDGSSTYAGMVGLSSAFLNLSGTIGNIAGVVVATGNLWSEFVLGDFNAVKAKLPLYARTSRTAWYCHQGFYDGVMEKLMLAAGGITDAMIAAGAQPRFLGFPVKAVQVMPNADANSQIACYLGDLTLAGSFGDRRQTTIAMSEHSSFANDAIDIRGTERFDINIHDIGNADATAANRVVGPVVALISASG